MTGSIQDKSFRLNTLYRIIDRTGNSIPFKMNSVQADVCACTHKRKLILKARQLGMSTYAILSILDDAIFHRNQACGIVSYSLEHAQHIFKRIIGHALDTFLADLKPWLVITSRSAHEISFGNGSFLRVDTSLRGGAYTNILVSEFGKTCARSPLKAEEVVTGTIQAVPLTGRVTIESTAEGNEGFYASMVHQASQRGNDNLSELDYHLFFYPWFREPSYVMAQKVTQDTKQADYFSRIQKESDCILSTEQRNWYCHQQSLLGDKIRQEFPSTVGEAFLSSSDAYYFALPIQEAYESNRCLSAPIYDALEAVYVSMDIGVNDLTVMIFFQVVHGEIRIIDMYSDMNKGVDFYSRFLLNDKKYIINTIFLPWDSKQRDGIVVENTYERDFRKYFMHTQTKIVVLPRTDRNLSIGQASMKLSRCVFDLRKVKPLLDHLMKYRKKWSEQYGRYLDEPYHDEHSNFADSFRYGMQAVTHIELISGKGGALQKHKEAVAGRHKILT